MINTGETKTESKITVNELVKSIDWKQGLIIAMGVPILILPSLYDLAEPLYAFGIVIWGISCVQGFLQNFAIGEMSVTFKHPVYQAVHRKCSRKRMPIRTNSTKESS